MSIERIFVPLVLTVLLGVFMWATCQLKIANMEGNKECRKQIVELRKENLSELRFIAGQLDETMYLFMRIQRRINTFYERDSYTHNHLIEVENRLGRVLKRMKKRDWKKKWEE